MGGDEGFWTLFSLLGPLLQGSGHNDLSSLLLWKIP